MGWRAKFIKQELQSMAKRTNKDTNLYALLFINHALYKKGHTTGIQSTASSKHSLPLENILKI